MKLHFTLPALIDKIAFSNSGGRIGNESDGVGALVMWFSPFTVSISERIDEGR